MIARLHPDIAVESVAHTVQQWKRVSTLTKAEQENIITRARPQFGENRERKKIGLFLGMFQTIFSGKIGLTIYSMTR